MSDRARYHVWPMRCCVVLLAVVLAAAAIACGDGGAPAVDGVTLSPSASPSGGDRQKGGGDETASPPATFTPSPATTGDGTGDDGGAGTPTPSPTRISDKTIRGNILVRLSQDPTLRGFEFKVVVTKGVVQLVGRVQTEKQKRAAEQIAVTEPGVKKVISYLQVTGGGGY